MTSTGPFEHTGGSPMAKVSEIMNARRSSPKNSVTNPDLAMLWRDLVAKQQECYVPELTLKQRGQLKLIVSALTASAGQIGPPVRNPTQSGQ